VVVRAKLIDSVVVRVQMLAELEEVIVYKDRMDDPERQATQRLTWQKRYV
jgi:FKBP12-rapamycin complex-associated protein